MTQAASTGAGRVAASAIRGASRLAKAALDIVYPPHCLACGGATATSVGLCPTCWRGTSFIAPPYCARLGLPFERDLGGGLLSPEAIARPPVFRRARAAALFDDGPSRRLVHRLKYGDRHEVATLMGRLMVQAGRELFDGAPVLLPMPLHRGRLWRRQFNQAALLAEVVGRETGLAVDPFLLERIKATRSQVGMSRARRASNVQGAFRVPASAQPKGRTVLLIDDVLTTGATANAAARVLLRAGAGAVDLVVFARVASREGIAI